MDKNTLHNKKAPFELCSLNECVSNEWTSQPEMEILTEATQVVGFLPRE